jgi:hypothetical protein
VNLSEAKKKLMRKMTKLNKSCCLNVDNDSSEAASGKKENGKL